MKLVLKDYLKSVNKSAYWLEKQTGIPHKTLGNMINRKTKSMTYDHMGRICKALNCTPNDIFEMEDSE